MTVLYQLVLFIKQKLDQAHNAVFNVLSKAARQQENRLLYPRSFPSYHLGIRWYTIIPTRNQSPSGRRQMYVLCTWYCVLFYYVLMSLEGVLVGFEGCRRGEQKQAEETILKLNNQKYIRSLFALSLPTFLGRWEVVQSSTCDWRGFPGPIREEMPCSDWSEINRALSKI